MQQGRGEKNVVFVEDIFILIGESAQASYDEGDSQEVFPEVTVQPQCPLLKLLLVEVIPEQPLAKNGDKGSQHPIIDPEVV
jgi:hypothetical protein